VTELARLDEAVAPVVAHARRGDAEAFTELVRTCRPLIYRWAYVDTGEPDDAEDIAQEVLVRLYRRLHTFREGSSFTTWLYRITRNITMDRERTRARRRRLWSVGGAALPARAESGAEDAVVRDDAAAILHGFMERLPRRQRQALDLVDLQGLTAVEAAALLGIDAGTVRAHLHRARRTLRSVILEHLHEMAEES
jgi:RNA polymerase sigma-70 factor (ECF subfamily)